MPATADPAGTSTGSMTREELAEADGRAMGRALLVRPTTERAAWWAGLTAVLGGPDSYRGLPAPPDGWGWAEDAGHTLAGSVGLAHLVHKEKSGPAVCGLEPRAWVMVGRWETDRREACPSCAGQRVMAS